MRAINDVTEKTEKIKRHQNASRPNLPEAVANALQYPEPETEDISSIEPSELDDEVSNRGNEHDERDRKASERDRTKTPEQDTGALNDLFQ